MGRWWTGQDSAVVEALSAPSCLSDAEPPQLTLSTIDFQNTQGIIFVVDSNDRERVSEAREELQRMLNEDELRDALLLVFANKQDLPNAMNAAEITDKLGLHGLRQRTWYIQAACATSGDGLYEGLEWVRIRPFFSSRSTLKRMCFPSRFAVELEHWTTGLKLQRGHPSLYGTISALRPSLRVV